MVKGTDTDEVLPYLAIVDQLKDNLSGKKQLMLSAFGVGMTWATAIVSFVDCRISDIVEV